MTRIADIDKLKCYAAFKVRKFEPLLYTRNTCLPKTTTCIGLQAEQIFPVYIYISIFYIFSILGVAFAALFPCYFQKVELLEIKTF